MSRTIVVTGGATGIGRAVAERFRADGDTVVITGRRAELLEKASAELGAQAVVCDGTDPDQVRRLVEALPGEVHVLVNNAGGNTDFSAPGDGDLAALKNNWLANYDANVLTAVLTTTALAPRIADRGAVVHVGSIAGTRGAGSYGAAKAALATWNQDVAAELGPRGITSNVVAPGFTAGTEFFQGRLTGERRERLLEATMTKREGEVGDIAAAIHFLGSPAARHITAQVLHVNGGALTSR
ncbi:SDR family NAD(P)-dependent oxidoreductase [Kribbella catacumbae]|uniref:SDR family NAD(P)-dependent oxidoreductase n=1 Tax=Kribbella catacumbae TaxID=460086 RepID=UPI00037609F9|nr:SDR family oxidoreductase [Kribbella catacumbae]